MAASTALHSTINTSQKSKVLCEMFTIPIATMAADLEDDDEIEF